MKDFLPLSKVEILLVARNLEFEEFASRTLGDYGLKIHAFHDEEVCRNHIMVHSCAVMLLHESFLDSMSLSDWIRFLRENSGLSEIILSLSKEPGPEREKELEEFSIFDVLVDYPSRLRLLNSVRRAAEKHEMSHRWTRLNQDLLTKNLELQETNSMLLEALEESRTFQAHLASSQKLAGIGEMTASVAHEFNNVLGAIRGYSQLALRKPEQPDELFELHKRIKKAVDRAVDVVGTLLECSSRIHPQQEEADINLAINETIDLCKQHLNLKGIQVHCQLEQVPKFAFDFGQLQQVFLNLITNAGHAIGKGGLIKISSKLINDQVHLRFEDSGRGIPPENIEKIFIPFFTTKRSDDSSQEKGSGLGLHVSRQIIESHNGHIRVESQPGKGTNFHISLPLHLPVIEKMVTEGKNHDSSSEKVIGEGYTASVLIVDDEPDIRGILRKFLEDKGIEVMEASDGTECLEIASESSLDLVILDVMMPKMNGFETLEHLRKVHPEVQVFIISGYSDRVESGQGIPEGVAHFLKKPFDLDVLDHLIKAALGDKILN